VSERHSKKRFSADWLGDFLRPAERRNKREISPVGNLENETLLFQWKGDGFRLHGNKGDTVQHRFASGLERETWRRAPVKEEGRGRE